MYTVSQKSMRFHQELEQGMAQYSNFSCSYYPDNNPLNVGFIAHLNHFVWLSYLGKLSNPKIENHKIVTMMIYLLIIRLLV